jgi:hypothetical protein
MYVNFSAQLRVPNPLKVSARFLSADQAPEDDLSLQIRRVRSAGGSGMYTKAH